MRVSEWIRSHPRDAVTISPDLSLDELLEHLLREPCVRDLYIVEDGDKLIGHISHRRVAHLILGHHRPVHTRRQIMDRVACGSARELMQTDFVSARPDEDLDRVLHRQLEHDVEDMPVVGDDGSLLGAVNLSAVLRAVHEGQFDHG